MSRIENLPPQQLSFSKKTKEWRKKHLDWADNRSYFNDNVVRKSVLHKKINYNLLNGKIDMDDMQMIINPDSLQSNFIQDSI